MFPHHEVAIARTVERFEADPTVLGLLLGGSIAHGFESESSDVDVMLVVSDEEFDARLARLDTAFADVDLAGYEGGYIDVKYVSAAYLDLVATRGSEPARFAFDGARVLFSRLDGLDERVAAAGRYPAGVREDRIARFAAQVEAWRWYSGEGERKGDSYLLATATSRVALFAGRMLLAHNEVVYPFHKWFLRVLDQAPLKPDGIVELIRDVTASPRAKGAERIADAVLGFRAWERGSIDWPNQFMFDTEQSWMRDAAALEEL
jgi:hypothetical protein